YDVAGACDSVAILSLTIVATPESVISGDSEISAGEFTTLTAEGGDSFSWNTGDTTATITVAPSDTTEYFVVVANDNFCTDTAFFTVNVSTNIAENSLQNCLIYPNPASEYVNVIAEDLETIYIYNAYGQLIQLLTVEQEYNHRVNTSDWAPGIYVLRCVDVMGRVSQSKLVIQHY
ncbi:MAG TPA: T9SS type A sorting domain-containing protein, partial [Bacteroidales bacterium]|nr:T9SS type A sorting domain-containing protein [Bacteroidales bacterium]